MVRLFRKLAEELKDLFATSLLFVLDVEPDQCRLDEWHDFLKEHWAVFLDSVDVCTDVIVGVHELGNFFFVLPQIFQVAHVKRSKQLLNLLLRCA